MKNYCTVGLIKSIKGIVGVFSLVLFISGCKNDKPEAGFNVSSTTVAVGDTVYFTNSSSKASYFQWSFGDNSYAISKNTAHAYMQAGDYKVTLTAIGDDNSNLISKSVTVTGVVSIYEGIGTSEVSLDEAWASIQKKFSGDDSIMMNDTVGSYNRHSVYYSSLGIILGFYNFTTTIDSTEYPDVISLIQPYSGYTKKGVTLGSDIFKAETAYGTPGLYTSGSDKCYYYDSLGIQFWTTASSSTIDEIDVYPASTSTQSDVMKSLKRVREPNSRRFYQPMP